MCRAEACCLPLPLFPSSMPSHQHQLGQPMRPRLPRKLAASARINLNKYWQVLEELMPARRVLDEADSNAINENLDNEQRLAAMQLSESLTVTGKTSPAATPETSTVQLSATSCSGASPMAVDNAAADENTPPSSTTSSMSEHCPST